jgi:hypothetical protein
MRPLLLTALFLGCIAPDASPALVDAGAEAPDASPGLGAERPAARCAPARCEGAACDAFAPTSEIVATDLPALSSPATVTPPPPLAPGSVRLVDGGQTLRPLIPAHRTSADGRIALVGGSLAALRLEELAPSPVVLQPRDLSRRILGSVRRPIGDVIPASLPGGQRLASFLCEPAGPQPRACGPGSDDDCYDLVLIQEVKTAPLDENGVVLVSIPLQVRVTSPKTARAEVAAVIRADPSRWRQSARLPFSLMAELLATGDGRVLVGRILSYPTAGGGEGDGEPGAELTYRISGGRTHRATFSLFYAYAEEPCDVQAWAARGNGAFTALRPLPAAPFDERLVMPGGARYGFAAAPMRDSSGQPYAETDVLQGSYPWVDREGSNILFSTVNPAAIDRSATTARYPLAREGGALVYVGSPPRGFAVVGAWTQGKTVMLDGLLNNDDAGFQPDDTHRVQLYRSSTDRLSVRVNGGGKDGTPAGIPNVRANNHHIESLENVHAMFLRSLPVTPRDVVWTITRGLAMAEIAFDDFMDPFVVLLAEMNASWTVEKDGAVAGYNPRNGTLNDGFRLAGGRFVHEPARIRLQNAAASRLYPVIADGDVDGPARIEPIALGGVHGRGLWLEPASRLRFALPAGIGAAARDQAFLVGVFVDARDALAGRRHVLSLAPVAGPPLAVVLEDGAVLHLERGADRASIDLSCLVGSWAKRWHHLAVLFEGRRATVFLDGNPAGEVQLAAATALTEGALVVGGASAAGDAGLRGWYDEVRLVVNGADQLTAAGSVELICNYARGTTLAVGPSAPPAWQERADRAELARARALAVGAVSAPAPRLVCASSHGGEHGIGRGALPAGTRMLRDAILLEGTAPLAHDRPRPDSRGRSFCRTCHVASAQDPGRPRGLQLSALAPGDVTAALDPRTQPMQPPSPGAGIARVLGFVPAGWLTAPDGTRLPRASQRGPLPILPWLLHE